MRSLQIVVFASAVAVANAALQTISNFGSNPSNVNMVVNFPANMKANAPVVVGLHGCGGDGPGFAAGEWTNLSEQYGFIGIFPSATGGSRCWDVSSKESMTHNGGSDSLGVVNMVKWVIANKGADPNRVFATGFSSGGMMTNLLLATYPEVFAGGAAMAGVPFFCFGNSGRAASDISQVATAQCPKGVQKTGKEWGDLVRAAYPGYTGPRPPMMSWHGSNDNLVYPVNLEEQIKEWANVFGISETPTMSDTLAGNSNWRRRVFGSVNANSRYPLEAVLVQGAGHGGFGNNQGLEVVKFFGIDRNLQPIKVGGTVTSPSPSPVRTTTRTTTTTRVSPPTSPSPPGNCKPKYNQCGGSSYTGATCCEAGSTCKYVSSWYSQCV